MSDRRLRELSRQYEITGATEDETALVRERLRRGLVVQEDLDWTDTQVALDPLGDHQVRARARPQTLLRAACLLTWALAEHSERSARDFQVLRRGWADLSRSPDRWQIMWRSCTGAVLATQDPWPGLLGPGSERVEQAYVDLIYLTRGQVAWHGGDRTSRPISRRFSHLILSRLVPFVRGHGPGRLPGA